MSNSGLCMCRLEKKLPSWCHLRMIDCSRPLHEQVFYMPQVSNLGHAVVDGAWLTLSKRCIVSYPLHAVHSDLHYVQVANADVFIPTTGPVDGRAIRSAKELKLIVQPASGYSNIDIETAAELGIPVCNSPGAASPAFHAKMAAIRRILVHSCHF